MKKKRIHGKKESLVKVTKEKGEELVWTMNLKSQNVDHQSVPGIRRDRIMELFKRC